MQNIYNPGVQEISKLIDVVMYTSLFRKFSLYTNNVELSCCRHFHPDKHFLLLFQVVETQAAKMDFSDMDSDAEEEEEERRMREMENLLYSQIHHQEECDGSAGVEEVIVPARLPIANCDQVLPVCDINESKKDSSKSPRLTEETVNAADSGVASLAASSPEPEIVDLASSDSDDEGIQGQT